MAGDVARTLARKLYLSDAGRRLWRHPQLRIWQWRGRPSTPPPLFKQRLVLEFAARLRSEILVETGTYLGDMIDATRGVFRTVYSIELDPRLHRRARKRFRHAGNVHLLPGDSEHMLPFVLSRIDRPTLFWLDAHQMRGGVRGVEVTPVSSELEEILRHDLPDHALLIDDARLFTGGSYPRIAQIRELVLAQHPTWAFEVKDDVIRAYPAA